MKRPTKLSQPKMIGHITHCYLDATPEPVAGGMAWYGNAYDAAYDICVKYDVPCLSFVQLNRDGITRESTDVVSGSDRLIWLCTSFSIFKMKSDEEIAEDSIEHGNRKLVPVVARHGCGLDDGDYISVKMFGNIGKIEEDETRNEIQQNARSRSEGFEIQEEIDEDADS